MPTTVKCPACGKAVAWIDAEQYRPFCSERCRLIDLGEWAAGSYSIPAEADGDAEHDEAQQPDHGPG
jgi:endogenous inhibitor of DNA gyrase (YacG/DUF329 family)